MLCFGTQDAQQVVFRLYGHPALILSVSTRCNSRPVMLGTSRLSLLLLRCTAAQVDAYGGEDDRPSGYQPRTLGTGLSSGSTSYSSPQLTAAHDGSEEVR